MQSAEQSQTKKVIETYIQRRLEQGTKMVSYLDSYKHQTLKHDEKQRFETSQSLLQLCTMNVLILCSCTE